MAGSVDVLASAEVGTARQYRRCLATLASLREGTLLRRGAWVLVLVGVAWRLTRWLLQFPVWGDEAYLALNFLDRDYLGLLRPLRCVQVAPVLFLWGELTVYRLLGGAEWALRLLPFLAGLASLPLFWHLARLSLPPRARYLAIGLFAVSYYPLRHSCEIKPYAWDLMVSLLLLLGTLSWWRGQERRRWGLALLALGPLGLAASYPAVFVAAGSALFLGWPAWRADTRTRLWHLAYVFLLLLGFGVPYLLVGLGQFKASGSSLQEYWAEWFPPAAPLALLAWLLRVHTGNLLAYPLGGPHGGSIVTFILCIVGIASLARTPRRPLLVLLLLPFGLTLAAAALHRYPYGGSARIAQHLAPAICLLAGSGLDTLLRCCRTAPRRRQALQLLGSLLASLGLLGLLHDCIHPYKTWGDREVRRVLQQVLAQARPEDQILVYSSEAELWPTVEWYLRQQPGRVALDGLLDKQRAAQAGDIWALCFGNPDSAQRALATQLSALPRPLRLVGQEQHVWPCGRIEATTVRCTLLHWTAPGTPPEIPAN